MYRYIALVLGFIMTGVGTFNMMKEEKYVIPEGNLVFEENFDGKKLDDVKWEKCPEWERCEGDCKWDNDMSYLDGDGHLVLRAEWDEENERVKTGGVRTRNKFEFGLGYYEASIKFDNTHGLWGAFWMMCGNVGGENNFDGSKAVEIDILESIWGDHGKSQHVLHWNGYGNKHLSIDKVNYTPEIYDGEFHTFGLDRTKDAYIFYIDGVETARFTSEDVGICKVDGYMKLTVEAAQWAGAKTQRAISELPSEMVVDYVRVYRKKP